MLDVWRFNLKKLSEVEVREEYQPKIWNMFAALEGIDGSETQLGKTSERVQYWS
jgi:hypothetical protein